jgi:hypothetical protein
MSLIEFALIMAFRDNLGINIRKTRDRHQFQYDELIKLAAERLIIDEYGMD